MGLTRGQPCAGPGGVKARSCTGISATRVLPTASSCTYSYHSSYMRHVRASPTRQRTQTAQRPGWRLAARPGSARCRRRRHGLCDLGVRGCLVAEDPLCSDTRLRCSGHEAVQSVQKGSGRLVTSHSGAWFGFGSCRAEARRRLCTCIDPFSPAVSAAQARASPRARAECWLLG